MSSDPMLKEKICEALLARESKEIRISDEGSYGAARVQLGLADVSKSKFRRALNSLVYNKECQKLVRISAHVYRLKHIGYS